MNDKTPNIRFKGFTDDWEQRKFGDIGTVAMCKRIFKEQTSSEGDVPFYKIGTFGGEPDAFIDRELFKEYKSKFSYPNKGDILLSASGTIGRTIEYTGNDEYFQDSNIVWLKHGDGIDNAFLEVLYSVVDWSCEGSTIKRLYNDNFLKTKFMMPKIEEQQKIGVYFKNLDHLITLHQRKYDQLLNIKKSMLEKMFPKNGKKAPEIRFVGFTDDWEQRKFGDIGTVAMCKRIFKEQTSSEGDVPFYKIGTFGGEPDAFIDRELFKEYKSKFSYPNKGDILLSASGTIGRTIEYTGNDEYFQDSNIVWLKHGDGIDNAFLEVLYSVVDWSCEGSTIKRLYNDNFLKTKFMMPKIEEQQKIGVYFKNLDHLITLHQRKLEKLENLKKSMLKQMLL